MLKQKQLVYRKLPLCCLAHSQRYNHNQTARKVQFVKSFKTCLALLCLLASCSSHDDLSKDVVHDTFPEAQSELREVMNSIANDLMTANSEGLREIHLDSDKFTKFGPRVFTRQDVETTNESEVAFWSSAKDVQYVIDEMKIDVFDDVAVATYYPQVSYERGGEEYNISGRQTLVFLKTSDGWKIIHEHGTVKR